MRLYFVLPIKMKWMVLVYFVMFAYDVYTYMSFGWQIGLAYGSEIVLALINLLVFIYGCKHRLSFRQNMHQKRRKAQFKLSFQNLARAVASHATSAIYAAEQNCQILN